MSLSPKRVALNLEQLEARDCPSASVFAQDHTLYITTEPTSDVVQLRDDGHGQVTASVWDGRGRAIVSSSGIDTIVMHLRGTHDWVDFTAAAPLQHNLSVMIDLGPGSHNRVHFELQPGIDVGGAFAVDLRGNLGHSAVNTVVGPSLPGSFAVIDHLADDRAATHLHHLPTPNGGQRIFVG
jgi:hypothetical protein